MSLRRDNMVFGQFLPNKLTNEGIVQAFRSTPYEKFLPQSLGKIAYCDAPLKLENQTGDRYVLPPLTLMRLFQAAKINRHERVLLVGDPTGYVAILLSYIAQQVTSLEPNPLWFSHLSKAVSNRSPHNVTLFKGPYSEGVKTQAPFDCIIVVGDLSGQIDQLLRQLKPRGRLLGFEALLRGAQKGIYFSKAFSLQKKERSRTKKYLFEAAAPCFLHSEIAKNQKDFYL